MTKKMKDSGIEWIGEIPEDWEITKLKNVLFDKVEKNDSDNPIVLSLARAGIKVRDISNNEGQLAESYLNYNKVSYGDLLLNPMDLISGANCNISEVEGVISPAYFNLNPIDNNNIYYYGYYFKLQYWNMVLFTHGKGVSFENRWTLNRETLLNYYLPVPPISKQKAITNFLDKKTQEIDNIISKTKKAIEEYKKYKQSLITETVTKGLDKNVKMKDSGIEWIGEIPEHWDIVKFKRLFRILNGKEIKNELNRNSENAIKVYGSGGVFKYTDDFLHNKTSILFGRKGTIGKPVIAEGKFWTVDTMYYTDIIHGNLKYIYYILKAFPWEIITTQTALPSITSTDLLNKYMSVAPLKEQEQIASYLDEKTNQIDQIISTKEKLLTEMEAYKKSLIYETVTGKREVE